GSLQTSEVIEKQSRGNTAKNNNNKITSIANRKRRPVLNENAVTNQTAAPSAHQRQHEHANHVVVPPNRKQGTGHGVETCRGQIDVNRKCEMAAHNQASSLVEIKLVKAFN